MLAKIRVDVFFKRLVVFQIRIVSMMIEVWRLFAGWEVFIMDEESLDHGTIVEDSVLGIILVVSLLVRPWRKSTD